MPPLSNYHINYLQNTTHKKHLCKIRTSFYGWNVAGLLQPNVNPLQQNKSIVSRNRNVPVIPLDENVANCRSMRSRHFLITHSNEGRVSSGSRHWTVLHLVLPAACYPVLAHKSRIYKAMDNLLT